MRHWYHRLPVQVFTDELPENARMASKGVFLTPTLSCYGIMIRPPWQDFLPPDGKVKNEQVMARGLDALKIADDAGVIIC